MKTSIALIKTKDGTLYYRDIMETMDIFYIHTNLHDFDLNMDVVKWLEERELVNCIGEKNNSKIYSATKYFNEFYTNFCNKIDELFRPEKLDISFIEKQIPKTYIKAGDKELPLNEMMELLDHLYDEGNTNCYDNNIYFNNDCEEWLVEQEVLISNYGYYSTTSKFIPFYKAFKEQYYNR